MNPSDTVDLWLLHEPGDAAQAAGLHAALGAEGLRVGLGLPDRDPAALLLLHRGATAQVLPKLRALREAWSGTALLLRCPAPREVDEVLALEMGADVVLSESAGPLLIAARWRALRRRLDARPASAPPPAVTDGPPARRLTFGRLLIDRDARRVALGGRDVALTEGEFEVLWLLASRCGEPLSRSELLAELRGAAAPAAEAERDRSIDSRVYRLRGKLGGGAEHGGIRTVRHRGYLFMPSAW